MKSHAQTQTQTQTQTNYDSANSIKTRLRLILGNQNADSKRLSMDEKSLHNTKEQFKHLVFEWFAGLEELAAIIDAANLDYLATHDLERIGSVMSHLANLGMEAHAYVENIESNLSNRLNSRNSLNQLIETAIAQGRLLPSHKAWAEELGLKNIDALKLFLKS